MTIRIGTSLIKIGVVLASVILSTSASESADEVHTPKPGTAERKAILAPLRESVSRLHHLDVVFVIRKLSVSRGWAWIQTSPQAKDGRPMYEDVAALLRKVSGRWTVLEIPCTEPDNPACLGESGYVAGLEMRFPGVPMVILPK
jgi:hypothetical protein